MKILLIGKFYTEGFAQHIKETFIEMGHNVITYDYGVNYEAKKNILNYRLRQFKSNFFEIYRKTYFFENNQLINLVALISNNNPDIILCCHDILTPRQLVEIKKKTNAPIILWYPDHIGLFNRSMFLNAQYDFLFFKDPYIVELLRKELGKENVFYLPEACNPKYHYPINLTEKDLQKYSCDITTAGNLHASRVAVFNHLVDYDCKIWGNPAPRWLDVSKISKMIQNEFVANEEKSKAFRAAKIVLNNLQPGEIWSVNVRTFEIAAAGGFQLVNYRKSIENLFKVDEEIVCYNDINELKTKIKYYLTQPEERFIISKRASKRALSEHTYSKRLTDLLKMISNSKSIYN